MARVLYTAFDIVPSPKGASTHILHNIRGLVNSQFDVHLLTPNDGLLPSEDVLEGARHVPLTGPFTKLPGAYKSFWQIRLYSSYSASRL